MPLAKHTTEFRLWDFICRNNIHYLVGQAISNLCKTDSIVDNNLEHVLHYVRVARDLEIPRADYFQRQLVEFCNNLEPWQTEVIVRLVEARYSDLETLLNEYLVK